MAVDQPATVPALQAERVACRVGVHEAVIGVGLEVEQRAPGGEDPRSSRLKVVDGESRCSCIGTYFPGHSGGRKSSTCWKARNPFEPVTAAHDRQRVGQLAGRRRVIRRISNTVRRLWSANACNTASMVVTYPSRYVTARVHSAVVGPPEPRASPRHRSARVECPAPDGGARTHDYM